jgi:hypothetical protein
MVLRPVVLAGLLTSVGCDAKPQAVRVFAPSCKAEADLAPSLAGQIGFMDRTFDALGFETARLDMPSTTEFLDAVGAVSTGWLFVSYTGHGSRSSAGRSEFCLAPSEAPPARGCSPSSPERLSVNECLLQRLPSTLSGAVVALDACQSAAVDPRFSPVHTSVISSSPYVIDSTSLFGDRLALALREAAQDPNCDGLVTDQEVFDALLLNVYREISVAENRTYPKLRRDSPSHIPLPVKPAPRKECEPIRDELERTLKGATTPAWRSLASALRAQLALDPLSPIKRSLPEDDRDYFILDESVANATEVREIAVSRGLAEFPDKRLEVAKQVARFATFTEIYLLSGGCEWTRVTRLRDDMLMAVERTEDLALALPLRRVNTGVPTGENGICQYRYSRAAPKALDAPVHCADAEGQCFQEPCND